MKRINWKQITLKPTDKVKAGERITMLGIGAALTSSSVGPRAFFGHVTTVNGANTVKGIHQCEQQVIQGYVKPLKKNYGCNFIHLLTFRGLRDVEKMFEAVNDLYVRGPEAKQEVVLDRAVILEPVANGRKR